MPFRLIAGKPWLAFVSVTAAALSQVPSPTPRPQFEVASVKPSNSDDRRPFFNFQNEGQFTARNITGKRLIQTAYMLKDFQISGGPSWLGSDLYDISAKPEQPAPWEQVLQMIQSLLAERFQLAIRRETREMPAYALVVAKNGPKMKAADEAAAKVIRIRRGLLTAPQADMRMLAGQLSNFLGRNVIDKTGLTGLYDVKLEWVPDEYQIAMFSGMGVPEGFGAPPADWHGPSIFTALEEQLGLKLESQKGPVEMFMIERVERPSAN
jgi:bla regulator protein blaR1